ncbi:MAG TPA: glycosyltransferase family 2 protein [Streptosporangiaceae bacterium]|nr:glycosyltransferase family 2 protein [Streptosporangiaceae bacterium]
MDRTNPLVSVIVPCYNSTRTLRLCLRSVLDQTYTPIELIVVDDGSTDDSAEIAASMGATVVRTSVNSGQSVARNLGADHANGEILFFLDSDVALDSRGVEVAVGVLQTNPKVGAICGVYDAEPLLPTSLAARYRTVEQYVWFNEVDDDSIAGLYSALFGIRADVFKEIGPFDPALRYTEDQDFGYRLLQRYDMRVTRAIHGRHDHDATLRTIFRKVFQRTRLGMQLWLQYRALPGGAATGSRALASATALGAVLALPLPVLVGPVGAAATPVLIGVTIALDPAMYRHAFASRGVAFGLYFTGVRLLVINTSAAAGGIGVVQYMLSQLLRRLPGRRTDAGQPAAYRQPSPDGS